MILVKDTDAKSVNAAILALNDDLDKQVKAVKNNNAGIVEGETYNINISGNSGSVKNALTITSTTGYTAPSTTVYDGSEAKTATIYTPDQEVNKTSSPTFNTVTAALNGNATSADKVNNVLTLNVDGTTTSYDGSEAKTINIGRPIKKVFLGNLTVGNYSIDISKYNLIEATLYIKEANSAISTVSAAIDASYLQNTFYFTSDNTVYKGATCLEISSKKIVQVYKYDFSGYSFSRLAVYGIYL